MSYYFCSYRGPRFLRSYPSDPPPPPLVAFYKQGAFRTDLNPDQHGPLIQKQCSFKNHSIVYLYDDKKIENGESGMFIYTSNTSQIIMVFIF